MLQRRHRAFTLIELLVVVAIITTLIAILLPALNAAREVSRTAVCLSNQGQWAVASQMYSNDNNDYVVGTYVHAAESKVQEWFLSLGRYVNVTPKTGDRWINHPVDVRRQLSSNLTGKGCPTLARADNEFGLPVGWPHEVDASIGRFLSVSYALNADFDGLGVPVSKPLRMVKRIAVDSPSSAVWLADGIERFDETAGQAPSWPAPLLTPFFTGDPAARAGAIVTGHQDGINTNLTFVDGHASTVAPVIHTDWLDVVQ